MRRTSKYPAGTQLTKKQIRALKDDQAILPDGTVLVTTFAQRMSIKGPNKGLIPYTPPLVLGQPTDRVKSHKQVVYSVGKGKNKKMLDKPRVIQHYRQ